MKLYKQLLCATAGCLLLGAASTAMAVGCPNGFIRETTVPSIEINGTPCVVDDVIVQGTVVVTNSPEFFMSDVDVGGPDPAVGGSAVTITGGESAVILRADVLQGDLSINDAQLVVVGASTVQNGNLTVNNNAAAAVQSNAVNGNITCTGNLELDAFDNIASGTINCTPN